MVDEEALRKKSLDGSQTATGLAAPGRVDSAVAWCALWGLSVTGVGWRGTVVAPTAGVWPMGRTHPSYAALPVLDMPVSPQRYRRLLRSLAWRHVIDMFASGGDGIAPQLGNEVEWLKQRGVCHAIWFPIIKEEGVLVPSRHLASGSLRTLSADHESR